jgi:hypothetical protein
MLISTSEMYAIIVGTFLVSTESNLTHCTVSNFAYKLDHNCSGGVTYNSMDLEVLMKSQIRFGLVLLFGFLVSGCAGNSSTATPAATEGAVAVEDKAGLIAALQGAGATVETGDTVIQDFFTPEGGMLKVNGADVQVFEYESTEAMEGEASQVAPDGGSVGTSMVSWMGTPHFYKAGRIIVLYVGSDQAVLGLLEKALGPQFAGG